MPIISNTAPHTSVNGDAGSFVLNSLEDEESFVVLERTSNDGGLDQGPILQVSSQPPYSLSVYPNVGSFPVFNNLTTSTASVIPNHTSHLNQTATMEALAVPFDSTNISVSVEEIEKRLQEVLHENINLKENLYQTNLAMKQQLSTVRLLQDRALDVQKNQQAKFEDTKALILKLGSEKNELMETNASLTGELNKLKEENRQLREGNGVELAKLKEENRALRETNGVELAKLKEEHKELKEANMGFGSEAAKLLSENDGLKKQLLALQETLQTVNENGKKASLQPTSKEIELHEVVKQLTTKLEGVERARRQQDFDIDKLQAQLGRAMQEVNESQRKLAHAENALEVAQAQTQPKIESLLQYGEKFKKYNGLLQQLRASVCDEQTRFNSLHSWLSMTNPDCNSAQFEISELRRLLAEEQTQSVARKENLYQAISTIHELLGDFQKLSEDLERVKADYAVKESHGMAYDEMQKKGFTERLDSLTAKLVEKEEALAISERHLSSLQEAVRLQNIEKKDEETKALEEKVATLTKEVAILTNKAANLNNEVDDKDSQLLANNQAINLLNVEVQNLRSVKDTVAVLEEQAKIYQADFEAERTSRETLVAEKDRLLEDLRHLQRRNQDLINELDRARNGLTAGNMPQEPANVNPRRISFSSQQRSPSPPLPRTRKFICPNSNCNKPFNTLDDVHQHVIACWGLQD